MKMILLALAAAIGCSKGSGPDCAAAIHHSMDLSKDVMPKDEKVLAKMTATGIQHCKDDKWSDEAVKCMIAAKDMTEAQACYGKLTKEQQETMNNAAK